MISCTEFIWTYSELFKFLHERYGKQAVIDFWIGISQNFLGNLDALVAQKGIQGMYEYWNHTLEEEGADYTMTVEEDRFVIDMRACPSVGLLSRGPSERYADYCEHCRWLYPPVIEPYGFDVHCNIIDAEKGVCRLVVNRKTESAQ
ncbi:MAG: hypothetical protein V1800_15060 [Candidatus Latescibacterota bacterium]